jgi:DNA-binding LytR/AlgR family response regulator
VYKTLDFTGIDLARKVNDSFPFCRIIYLTNNLEYAPLVYETNHCYLVLQSDMHTTLRPAIMKAIDIHKHDLKADALEVKSGGHRNFINRKDILYIERENRKIKIVTESRSYSCYLSLKELLSKLGDNMIRTHGGYAVNMEYITFFGKDYIELKSEIKIPVGRTYEADARRAYLDFWSQSK